MGSRSNPAISQMRDRRPHRLILWAVSSTVLLSLGLSSAAFSQSKNPAPASAAPTAQPAKADSGSANPANHSILRQGSQGSEVVELQAMLKLLGYYSGAVNGTYDQSMATAVAQFQKAAGLSADGIAGAETWNRLLPPTPTVSPSETATKPLPPSSEVFPAPSSSKPNVPATKDPPAQPSAKPAEGTAAAEPKNDPAALPILRIGMQGSAVSGLQERLRALGFLKSSADGVFGAETREAVQAAQRRFKLEPDGVVGVATWLALLR